MTVWWIGWSAAAFGGVWVRAPGAGYAQLTVGHQASGRVWLPGGEVVEQTDEALLGQIAPLFDDGRFSSTEVAAYGELGLAPGLEVYGSVPARFVQNRWSLAASTYPDIVHENAGLGDLTVGARYGRSWGGLAVSGYAGVRAPLYNNRPKALNMEPGNADFEDDRVPLGPGTLDVDVGGGVGYGLRRGWALAEVGLRLRSSQMSSAVPARVQLGAKPIPRVAAWVGADLTAALGDGAAPSFYRDTWGKGPVVINDASSLALGAGAIVEIHDGFGVIGTVSRTVWAVRFPALTGGTLGVCFTPGVPTKWR